MVRNHHVTVSELESIQVETGNWTPGNPRATPPFSPSVTVVNFSRADYIRCAGWVQATADVTFNINAGSWNSGGFISVGGLPFNAKVVGNHQLSSANAWATIRLSDDATTNPFPGLLGAALRVWPNPADYHSGIALIYLNQATAINNIIIRIAAIYYAADEY